MTISAGQDETKASTRVSASADRLLYCRPQELEQQFERERVSLEEQKALLLQQLEELRQELTSKLAAANVEVRRGGGALRFIGDPT